MSLKITSPRYNKDGTIDCTWGHPRHGIIQFTASKFDCEPHGRFLFDQLETGIYGEVQPYIEPEV